MPCTVRGRTYGRASTNEEDRRTWDPQSKGSFVCGTEDRRKEEREGEQSIKDPTDQRSDQRVRSHLDLMDS